MKNRERGKEVKEVERERGRGGRLGEVWRYFNNIPQSRRGGDSTQERTERKRGGEVELNYDEPREEDN